MPLKIPKQTWPSGSSRIPVPTCYKRGLAYLVPSILNDSAQKLGCPSPETLPYIIQTFWLLFSFCTSGLPSAALSPLSLLPSPPPPWPSSTRSRLLWTLPEVPASAYALPPIYNKLSPPPYREQSCPFLFISSFYSLGEFQASVRPLSTVNNDNKNYKGRWGDNS